MHVKDAVRNCKDKSDSERCDMQKCRTKFQEDVAGKNRKEKLQWEDV